MFQFPSFPSYSYVFTVWYIRFTLCEFPHSDIRVSLTAYVSSRHFVVCHVLLRLLVPRHSPHALFILTYCLYYFFIIYCFSVYCYFFYPIILARYYEFLTNVFSLFSYAIFKVLWFLYCTTSLAQHIDSHTRRGMNQIYLLLTSHKFGILCGWPTIRFSEKTFWKTGLGQAIKQHKSLSSP